LDVVGYLEEDLSREFRQLYHCLGGRTLLAKLLQELASAEVLEELFEGKLALCRLLELAPEHSKVPQCELLF
jgi:hypothetical protein